MTHLTLEQFAELGSASADLAAGRFERKLASKFTEGDTEADIEAYEALLRRFGFAPVENERPHVNLFRDAVQAFVLRHAGSVWPGFDVLDALGIVQLSRAIPDERIPEDWAEAAEAFCYHVTHLGYPDECKPAWLPDDLIDYEYCRRYFKSKRWGRSRVKG